jgi:hypothetical protein
VLCSKAAGRWLRGGHLAVAAMSEAAMLAAACAGQAAGCNSQAQLQQCSSMPLGWCVPLLIIRSSVMAVKRAVLPNGSAATLPPCIISSMLLPVASSLIYALTPPSAHLFVCPHHHPSRRLLTSCTTWALTFLCCTPTCQLPGLHFDALSVHFSSTLHPGCGPAARP